MSNTQTRLNLNAFSQLDFPFPGTHAEDMRLGLRKSAQYLQVLCTQTGFSPEKVFPLELMACEGGHSPDRKVINERFFALIEESKKTKQKKSEISPAELKKLADASQYIFVAHREDLLSEARSTLNRRQAELSSIYTQLSRVVEALKEAQTHLSVLDNREDPKIDLPQLVQEITASGFFRFDRSVLNNGTCQVHFEIGPIHWRYEAKLKGASYNVNFGSFKIRWTLGENITLGGLSNNLARGNHIFPYANSSAPWKNICLGDATQVFTDAFTRNDYLKAFQIIEDIFSKDTFGNGYIHPKEFDRMDTVRANHEVRHFNGSYVLVPLECRNGSEANRCRDHVNIIATEDREWSKNSEQSKAKMMKFYLENVQGKYGEPADDWLKFAKKNGLWAEDPVIPSPDGVVLSSPVEKKKRTRSVAKKQQAREDLGQPVQQETPQSSLNQEPIGTPQTSRFDQNPWDQAPWNQSPWGISPAREMLTRYHMTGVGRSALDATVEQLRQQYEHDRERIRQQEEAIRFGFLRATQGTPDPEF